MASPSSSAWASALALAAAVPFADAGPARAAEASAQPATRAERAAAVACRRWRHGVRIAARRHLGRDARPDRLLAQLSAESGCDPRARSPAGALGLAQFMRGTADHVAGLDPALAGADRFSPRWSIRAQAAYMAWLLRWARGLSGVGSACAAWPLAEAAYNAGLGWIGRERAAALAAGGDGSWASMAGHCLRSPAACAETRGYVSRIDRRTKWFRWLAWIRRRAC